MSDKAISIGAHGDITPKERDLSKTKDELVCSNNERHDYELIFDDAKGSPFDHDTYTIPAGAVNHRIGKPTKGIAGERYQYHSKIKGATAAADPVIIITN